MDTTEALRRIAAIARAPSLTGYDFAKALAEVERLASEGLKSEGDCRACKGSGIVGGASYGGRTEQLACDCPAGDALATDEG